MSCALLTFFLLLGSIQTCGIYLPTLSHANSPALVSRSGSVCLDVINQTWSPMYDMINIFEVFLPQLLRYPNPTDPLNGEAAALIMREPKAYDNKVKGARFSFNAIKMEAACVGVIVAD
jgi:hypothetical protein